MEGFLAKGIGVGLCVRVCVSQRDVGLCVRVLLVMSSSKSASSILE